MRREKCAFFPHVVCAAARSSCARGPAFGLRKNRQRFCVKKAFCFLCKRSFVLFPQTHAARYPVSQRGSVVTVAGGMCIFPARGVCGSKILCKRPCVRSAEKNRQRFRVKKAFCFLCNGSFVLFPQTYAARHPVSQCGSVVTVAGEMCIFPARGVCGSKILCKGPAFGLRKKSSTVPCKEGLLFAL